MEDFIIKLQAELDKAASKKQINSDIRELQKSINMLRLTATLMKGDSKMTVNQAIRQMEGQLKQVKLKVKIDQRNLKSDINNALNNVSFKDIQMNFDGSKVKLKAKKVIADAQKAVQNSPLTVNIELKKAKLDNQLTAYLSKNSKIKESQGLLNEADKLREKISQIGDKDSLRSATDSFQLFKSEVQATGYQSKSTSDRIKGLVGYVTKIGSAFGVASVAVSNFQKSLKTIKTNDDLLTEISKTSNSSKQELEELGDSAFQTASKFGQLSSDYLTAVQEMNRSGFYGKTGNALGELSLKAQAAGDISADMAQKYILATSAAYGYKGSIEQLTAVLDGQNAITNSYSVDLETLASATTRAGSVAANSGVKIDELSAIIGTISARTKEAGEKTGTGIKSMLINLQNVSSDKIVNTLNKANASMTETVDGIEKLRNPIDILKDLAKTYNALDESDPLKSEIITNIGQKYHANQLSSLLTGWADYEKMLRTYSEGMGSADREAQKTADSLSGHLNALQNSWDSLVNTVTDKDALKDGISLFDGLINSAEKLIDVFNVIPVAMAGVTAFKTAKDKDYGITKIFDWDSGKLDLEGNFMGIDFTQMKHFREASEAFIQFNDKIVKGAVDVETFNSKVVQNNVQLKEYLKTCSVDAPASLEGYKQSLQAAGVEVNSLRLGTMLLSTGLSFGIGIAVQSIITGVSKLASASSDIQQKAKEIGSSFNETKSEIEDYKTKIKELQSTVNDSSASISDVTEARKNLMAIQDELIGKYGSETDTIHIVTDAINDQADALDNLSKKKYIESKNKFNKEDFFENISNNFSGYSDNMDKMVTEMEDPLTLNLISAGNRNMEEYKKFEKIISQYGIIGTGNKRAGGNGIKDFAISLDGGLDSIYEKLLKIQETASHYDFGSDDFNNYLTNKINETKEKLDDYSDLYKNYVLYDKILSDSGKKNGYDETFKILTGSYNRYKETLSSGNREKTEQAQNDYAKLFTEATKNINDNSVIEYFENMYPELQEIVGSWRFNLDFSQNTQNIKTDVQTALNQLNKDGFTVESLTDFKRETASEDQIQNYSILEATALKYGMSIEEFVSSLEKMKLVQTENYKQLISKFGEDKVKTLSVEDIEIAYTIKSTDGMTFEQLKREIKEIKDSASDSTLSFSESWSKLKESDQNTLKKATLEGVLDKDSISQYQELADNFSLKQIRDEILSLIPLDDKLSQFIDDSEKLTSAYTEMKKNKTVSTKTLLGMPEGIRRLDGYTDFRDTVSNPKTSKADKKGAFEDIITEYLNANQTIIDASDETRDYVVNTLKDAGIVNAETLVDGVIHCKDTIKKVMTEVEDANETDVKNFAKACTSKNLNNTKLYNKIGKNTAYMLNQLKDKYAADVNNFGKALQSKLKAEKEYASAVLQLEVAANGNTSNSAMPNFFGKSYVSKDSEEYKNYAKKKKELDKVKKNYRKQLKKLQKDLKKVNIAEIQFNPTSKDTSDDPKKNKKTKTKTEIDWLSRRLTRMQSIIDLTASKLQNLFSVKAKNENINDQIKETTALMKQYGVAADRYKKKANSIAAGKKKGKKKVKPLSKSIINQVKSGKITKKSYPKLIKKYGQSYADRINQYIDYYDKAQDAKKNKQDAKAKLRDLKQQGLQYYVDDYNAKAELAELRSGNAVGYQKQNSYVDTQLSYLQKSYKKKIAIAKLSKDKTEQDRLQEEYKAKETELKQNQVEHIKTDFENKIGFIRNDGQDVSNRISEIEARGDIVQSSYYSALNRYEQSSLSSMNTELQELKKKQGSFAMYSPEWYSLQSDIQSVENSISETNISIIENNKKIGELRQAMYDDIASRNNNAGSEAQFIAGLLGDNLTNDKTGSLTKEGLGVLGTYGIELEANTNTALSYANQRKEIEQAIASYNSGNVHALDSYGSLKKAKEKLNEAIKNQQEATTAEYATMKKIYDMMVKRYETQLAYMKSIIDAKKQVLSMEKDLYDYQKNISNQTKNIATLEKQLAALKGDDSEEGRAKRSKLMVSLDEANQNLQDTEYDRYISDQENMLDNMYTQYEDLLSELEKDFEAVVKDGINIINETASGISTTLNDIANKYGYNPSSDMRDILGVMKSSNDTIVKTLPETITNGLSSLGKIFQDGTNNIITNYSKEPPVSGNNSDATKGGGSGSGSNPGGKSDPYTTTRYTKENAEESDLRRTLKRLSGKNDSAKPLKPAKPNKQYKSELNKKLSEYDYVVKDGIGSSGLKYINMFAQALGVLQGDGSFSSEGVAYQALKKKYPSLKFRTGGIVRASGVSKDGDNIPVRVNPDETILTQDFTKMLPDAVDIMKDFVKVPDYARLVQPGKLGNTFGDIVINAELPNVKDGHSFISEVQNEIRSQRFLMQCVDDCVTKGRLTHNIQRF